jgi:hypothetical protein
MNRADLQQLAAIRLAEAQALLAAGFPCGAYYLAGYAVECAIKACIAKNVQQYDFPDKDRVNQSYSHNLVQLIRAANLEVEFDAAKSTNQVLGDFWKVVKDWSESDRYDATITIAKAANLIGAITDPANGVMPWLAKHW